MLFTHELLKRIRICPRNLGKFVMYYPDGLELTFENFHAAHRHGLQTEFFFDRVSAALERWLNYADLKNPNYGKANDLHRLLADQIAYADGYAHIQDLGYMWERDSSFFLPEAYSIFEKLTEITLAIMEATNNLEGNRNA